MTDLEKRAEEMFNKMITSYLRDCGRNRDYAREIAIKSVVDFAQQETKLLSQHILDLQADKGRLTDENKRLQLNEQLAINNSKLFLEQLTEAKDIIRELLENTPVPEVYSDGSCEDKKLLELIAKAEAFLKE